LMIAIRETDGEDILMNQMLHYVKNLRTNWGFSFLLLPKFLKTNLTYL
jgi:hypothetical protein